MQRRNGVPLETLVATPPSFGGVEGLWSLATGAAAAAAAGLPAQHEYLVMGFAGSTRVLARLEGEDGEMVLDDFSAESGFETEQPTVLSAVWAQSVLVQVMPTEVLAVQSGQTLLLPGGVQGVPPAPARWQPEAGARITLAAQGPEDTLIVHLSPGARFDCCF